ncbi:Pycsar system effector family protein [Spirosoma foliorum]|uniref:Metal-dependent phosphohydrolase n=1 Tax=Spirosoma foliorum TaxID=2710596 RepID=A0A7G5GST1_9BACT|nr:Pycsar system effector family protein [Spirosoma foliorum]QMW01923.1 metal-dependent phosphohydrolase [Spirosoma foliorum]
MSPTPQEAPIDSEVSPSAGIPELDRLPIHKPKKDKGKKASKGVETLFRTTMSNHMKLSEMADRKANLMISINAIIISITISTYARKFDAPANLLIPSLLLLAVCLVTIIVSLLATNPTISPLKKRGNVETDRPIDLLFFGYYSQLSRSEYRQKLRTLLGNDDDLYNSLIDNIYAQGQVLSRKYRLLKFAYQFFMIGFSIVVISAVIALITTYYS